MTRLYGMPRFRLPSEGGNLIVQPTLGCGFNQYSFRTMYRSRQLSNALADGDALAPPTEHLLAIPRCRA